MPISMKKRYPRAVRFRKIASNNNQIQQTRRDPLRMVVTNISAQTATVSFDKPFSLRSDWKEVTGIRGNGGAHITLNTIEVTSAQTANLHFNGVVVISEVDVPFEDLAFRSMVGAYIPEGTYQFNP